MNNPIESLQIYETATVDTSALRLLQQSLGTEPSRDVIERATFEISDRLCKIEFHLTNADLVAVDRVCGSLQRICAPVGLDHLSCVACDLKRVIAAQDYVAIASVSHRLFRLGENALFSVVSYAESGALA